MGERENGKKMEHRKEEIINELGLTSADILKSSYAYRLVVHKKLKKHFTNLFLKCIYKYTRPVLGI
jgi:hypothetical protein